MTEDESNHLFGFIGCSNSSGLKFSKIFARDVSDIYCGKEKYTVKEFLSRKEDLRQEYIKDNSVYLEELDRGLSLLEKLFKDDDTIEIMWG